VQAGPDIAVIDLVADVPVGVVVAGIGAGVEEGFDVLGGGVVGEAQFDLGEEGVP
jgi:hypothetical protein